MSCAHPGRHTEEHISIVTALLRGEAVDHVGDEFEVHVPARGRPVEPAVPVPVPVLVSALAPRLLGVAGEQTDGRSCGWARRARSRRTSPRS